jgi:hypothetical protein
LGIFILLAKLASTLKWLAAEINMLASCSFTLNLDYTDPQPAGRGHQPFLVIIEQVADVPVAFEKWVARIHGMHV